MNRCFFLFIALFWIGSLFGINNPAFEYHQYSDKTPECIQNFYLINHANQTLQFVLGKKEQFLPPRHLKMSIWDALKLIETVVDDSNPESKLGDSGLYYRTAEALRKDGHPRWLILTGFIYDLGKVLTFLGEPPWAVMGDTFPVGCQFSKKIVYPTFFQFNEDIHNLRYQLPFGIYAPHCGFDRTHLSWGQDEYLYHVVKDYIPPQAAYIIRYRSFYAFHREGCYQHLMNDYDWEMLPWLQLFNQYELTAKKGETADTERPKLYYEALIEEFFPPVIDW